MSDLDAFLDAFLDALIVQACRVPNPTRPMTPNDLVDSIRQAQRRAKQAEPAPDLGWSEWLDWKGGKDAKCPLPPRTKVEWWEMADAYHAVGDTEEFDWSVPTRFRYRCLPGGWFPRGDWIPPAELWRDDCPVRCEWRFVGGDDIVMSGWPSDWNSSPATTHIRLVAREIAEATQPEPAAVPEMPAGVDEVSRHVFKTRLPVSDLPYWFNTDMDHADLDHIAEGWRILAARRRAGL